MFVGVLSMTFRFDGVRSLKAKRMRVRPIVDRCRARYNASVAEVGQQDVHDRAELAATVVSGERAHAERMIETIAREMTSGERVLDWSSEVLSLELASAGVMAPGANPHTDGEVGRWEDYE